MKKIILNNGVEMPQHGFGTYMIPKDMLCNTLLSAYNLGYRQFDTAWRYYNEADIAKVFKENNIKREDVFITSKFNCDSVCRYGYHSGKLSFLNGLHKKSIRAAIQESFDNLRTDYIDLYLIHWPYSFWKELWLEMVDLYKQGKFRAIGVCSFLPPQIEALMSISDIVPAVNQFEISPLNTQKQLIQYCKERGIAVTAMSTFSHFRSVEPREELMEHELLMPIARKYNKSVVQIVFKWLLQQDIIIIPKTWNLSHLKENISLYDFELTQEEMSIIDSLDQGQFLNYNPYQAVKGYKRFFKAWRGFNK